MKKLIVALMLCLTVFISVDVEFYNPEPAYAAYKKKKTVQQRKNNTPPSNQQSRKPRNLLTEYYIALKNANSQKAISLLNEGLNVDDATDATFKALKAKMTGADFDISDTANSAVLKGTSILVGALRTVGDATSQKLGGTKPGIEIIKLSDSYVKSYKEILQSLKNKGSNFSNASYYTEVFLDPGLPTNLFYAILETSNKKVFTGKELSRLLLWYRATNSDKVTNLSIAKLKLLVNYGAKINKSDSSDNIVSNILKDVLPSDYMGNNYLQSKDVAYLKKVFSLLVQLGVNAGPRERSFWQVMSTKTPWEILADYRGEHRNEPDVLRLCNEIEQVLPPVGN